MKAILPESQIDPAIILILVQVLTSDIFFTIYSYFIGQSDTSREASPRQAAAAVVPHEDGCSPAGVGTRSLGREAPYSRGTQGGPKDWGS